MLVPEDQWSCKRSPDIWASDKHTSYKSYITSSPKGNDRSPEASHQNILNSSQVKDFLNWSSAANSAVHGWIRPNFKLIRDYIIVLVTCKNGDPIKNEGARVLTSLLFDFSDAQGQLTPKSEGIPPKFELIQDFIVVLVTCKNEKDPIKNKGSRVLTRFSPL